MNKTTFIILLAILTLSGGIFTISNYQKKLSIEPNTDPQITDVPTSRFIGCLEQRDYLAIDKLMYIACDGGVVAVDMQTKNIVKTLTMADGLANEFITSLVNYKDYLYIGSQDGITQYNLTTHDTKIINTQTGLSNGANIKLLLDEDRLWVATFDGLDSIDLKTLKVTHHKKAINPEVETLNTVALAKGGNFIYASILGSNKSSAFVARFNTAANTWEVFEANRFANAPSTGLNIYDFYTTQEGVYAFDLFNTGQNFELTFEELLTNNRAWKQILGEDSWRSISEEDKETVQLAYDTKKKKPVTLINDYTTNKVWHVINTKVISGGGFEVQGNALLKVDHKTLDKNIIQGNADDTSLILFEPLEYTNLSLAVYQSCGQGCSRPKVYLHNYVTEALDEVLLPVETAETLNGYAFVSAFDSKELVLYTVDTTTLEETSYTLDTLTKQFTKLTTTKLSKLPDLVHPIKTSNNVYDFNSRFTLARRLVTATTKEDIAKLGITYTANEDLIKLQYKGKEYTLKMLPKRYSPFADWLHTIEVRKIQIDQNVVWVGTDRGLMRIDANTGVTTLFGPKDGLISPNVKDFIAVDGKVITAYNGISIVE